MTLHPQLQQLEQQFYPSILTPIKEPLLTSRQLQLTLKRDDLLHPIISGNKWRKLKYCLNHALSLQKTSLISMGGAYSNHLHALAFVGRCLSLKTTAFIRGEPPAIFNSTLQDLVNWGMTLRFISRSDYRVLRNFKTYNALPELKADEYWIPEGGATEFALPGIAELIAEINCDYDILCTACGTGTTLAGIVQAININQQALGFSALKGADFLNNEVKNLLTPQRAAQTNWQIIHDYHCGGFGKMPHDLLKFIQDFESRHQIPLEPIYTGKMLFGLYDLIQQDYFAPGQKIIALHTGGLQGKRDCESIQNCVK